MKIAIIVIIIVIAGAVMFNFLNIEGLLSLGLNFLDRIGLEFNNVSSGLTEAYNAFSETRYLSFIFYAFIGLIIIKVAITFFGFWKD